MFASWVEIRETEEQKTPTESVPADLQGYFHAAWKRGFRASAMMLTAAVKEYDIFLCLQL